METSTDNGELEAWEVRENHYYHIRVDREQIVKLRNGGLRGKIFDYDSERHIGNLTLSTDPKLKAARWGENYSSLTLPEKSLEFLEQKGFYAWNSESMFANPEVRFHISVKK